MDDFPGDVESVRDLDNESPFAMFRAQLLADVQAILDQLPMPCHGGSGLGILTSKGDLVTHNGSASVRLPVGSNDQVLTADSAQSAGVKWATPGGGGGASADAMLRRIAFS